MSDRAPLPYRPRALATARLVLEPIVPAHAKRLFAALADPALYRFLGDPPASEEALRTRFTRLANPHAPDGGLWLNFAARHAPHGAYVGCVQATVRPDLEAHIAYFTFTPAQRQGIAHEGCSALLLHLWRDCGVSAAHIEADTRNVASQRLAAALGFRRVGDAVATTPVHGAPARDYVYRRERPAALPEP